MLVLASVYPGSAYELLVPIAQLVNGQSIKFPELIPGQVNVFDISSPFWQQIQGSESVKGAARVVGYSFGFVDGYKKVGIDSLPHPPV